MAEQSAPTLAQKLSAEFLGTFILVFTVIGAALFAAGFGNGEGGFNVGFLGVALALGFGVLASAYAFGGISGGHFNPAVTVGLATAGRFAWSGVLPYVVAQALGAVAGAAVLWTLKGFDGSAFVGASTGYGELSPAGFDLGSAFLIETVATAVFVLIILGVTGARGAGNLAPIAIGLTLSALAIVAIPVSNASFNPARSLGTAVFAGGAAMEQLWLSVAAPVLGAVIAALVTRLVLEPARKG
ncbi:MAG TPA: aquaporin [Microbacteriaceae bacterium]|nr:aquaporin [Microbacteriaceae bacterium]